VHSFRAIFGELSKRIVNPFRPITGLLLLNGYAGLKEQIRFIRSVKYVKSFLWDVIHKRKKETEQEGDKTDAREKDGSLTLLDLLLAANMEPAHILDECMTFLVAGHDTCAHTMAWCLYLIATHHEVEQKILGELRQTCVVEGKDGPKLDLNHENLNNLRYLWCVIQETFRLYPPIAIALRTCTEADTLGDYPIPPGTAIGLFFYALHRHPQYWPNPDSFLPERFYTPPTLGTFGPFSWGKRSCIGQYFATVELKLILATLIWNFHFEADATHTVGVIMRLTNQPMYGLKFFPRTRT